MLRFAYQRVSFAVAICAILSDELRTAGARICQEKCKEYADLVYEIEESPVLLAGRRFESVSRCGIIETPLIVGGETARPMEFPHMAVIGYGKDEENSSWQCGGTIISDSYILTAAHCLESYNGPAAKVRVGVTNLTEPEDSMQERDVSERIKHPLYRHPVKYHDIALLKLERPLTLNSRVRPACLETESRPPGKSAIACGFGKTSYEARVGSDVLMKVQLNYVSEDECKRSFALDLGRRMLPEGLISNLLCAGVVEGGKDTCQGDSGGPLQRVLEEPYCMYSVVAITSFGKFCAFKDSPAIYTRVSSYLDWIESVVWPRA